MNRVQGIMGALRTSGVLLLLAVLLVAGCAASRPEWLREEDEACFRLRDFTEQIPRMHWGDPLRDPCWRYRGWSVDR